jgi:acyl-homoserine-lactone acylase
MNPPHHDQVSRIQSLALSRRTLVRSAAAGGAALLGHTSLGVRGAAAQDATPVGASGSTGAELLWDTWGVPHIFADDTVNLFYAFGWAQMHAHGDLLLRLYGQARGRAAEYWGERYLESDRWLRTIGTPSQAAEWYAAQSPGFRANLDAFAAGFNAYARQHPERLADEVRVVLPATAEDVLAHTLRFWLFFVWAGGDQGADLIPFEQFGIQFSGGSNGWAIAPQRSTSGNALLLANPHLFWADFVFFEAQLAAPGIDVYGATPVGLPVLGIAFNDALGWTLTVNTVDGWDAYELTPADGGYRFDGEVRAFEAETQMLTVRQEDGTPRQEELVVRRSVHGPIIAERNGSPIALRVVAVDRWVSAAGVLEQWWEMGQARSLDAFETALRRMQLPMTNVLYADRDGHVLFVSTGQVPIRSTGDWEFWADIVPGDTSATLWSVIHPYDDLPRVINPPGGWVQNANEPPWTATLPFQLRPEDFPPYMAPPQDFPGFRAQRSMRMLTEDPAKTLDDLVDDVNATEVEFAFRILDDLIVSARQGGAVANRAAEVLAAWDRRVDAGSRGALLFVDWVQALAEATGLGTFLFATPWSAEAPLDTPHTLADPQAAVVALEVAAERTEAGYGALDVAWGDVARLRYGQVDLPASGGPGDPYGIFRDVDFAPASDGLLASVGGDTFIAAVEFGDPVQAQVLTTYGNASQPDSPHLGDQLALFARKEMRQAWRTREEIAAHLEAREVLTAGDLAPAATPAP